MKMKYDTSTTKGRIAVMQHCADTHELPLCRRFDDFAHPWEATGCPRWNWAEYDYNYPAEPEPPKLVPWTFETCPKGVVLLRFKEGYGCDLITTWACDGVSTAALPVIGWNRLLNAYLYSTDGKTWLHCGTEEKR